MTADTVEMPLFHFHFGSTRARAMRRALTAQLLLLLAAAAPASATEIARWDFDDGTANDSVGTYDFAAVGGGPAISGGTAVFDGNEGSPSFLETAGYGGSASWTVALRIRAGVPIDQGSYQGIFSNNSSAAAPNSWQLETFGGVYQFRTTRGLYSFGAPTGGWDTIVIRKSAGDGDVWLNGTQVVSSFGNNPGGLQNFRFGTNRNSDNFYAFEADYARVFDTYEDPTVVPEPNTAILLAMGLAALTSSRTGTRGHGATS